MGKGEEGEGKGAAWGTKERGGEEEGEVKGRGLVPPHMTCLHDAPDIADRVNIMMDMQLINDIITYNLHFQKLLNTPRPGLCGDNLI